MTIYVCHTLIRFKMKFFGINTLFESTRSFNHKIHGPYNMVLTADLFIIKDRILFVISNLASQT